MYFENFDIGQLLGNGGFATVYRAKCRATGENFAIKIIEKMKMKDSGIIDRVWNEIEIHSEMKHESIVSLFGYFEDERNIYLVMELCNHGNMYRFLRKHAKLSEADAAFVIAQLLSALGYMHDKGVLHRDLKLSNILLNGHLIVKICDFGLAVQIEHPDEEHYTFCGTPNYIAPEIAIHSSHAKPGKSCWNICRNYLFILSSYRHLFCLIHTFNNQPFYPLYL